MNKAGIYKIEMLGIEKCHDWSNLPPNSRIKLRDFYLYDHYEVPFTQETAEYSEQRTATNGEQAITISVIASVRASLEHGIDLLQRSFNRKLIFQLFFIDGTKILIGSKKSPAKISFDYKNTNVEKKEINFTIECQSLHGAIYNIE